MNFIIREFDKLSVKELFQLYRLRSEVFVVEQNCAYQDVDDKDLSAIHVLLYDEDLLAGYCRILPPSVSYKEPSIGRVATSAQFRGKGLGKLLMKQSLTQTLELFKHQDVVISAQTYLIRFYKELGFKTEGEGYDEDGIPHIKMRYVNRI
jgi:ElaA protein